MSDLALVTGGAGFIGSHVVDELLARGWAVRVLDNLHPAAHARRPGYLDGRCEVVWGDVRDAGAVEGCLDGVTAVSHHAAMVGMEPGLTDAPAYVDHNVAGTATLLAALARRGFDGRLVLAGSMAVYGEGRYECAEHGIVAAPQRARADLEAGRFEPPCPTCGAPLEPRAVLEDAKADPRSVYAATKLHQEHLCAAFAHQAGAPLTVLRYHNVYGPRMPRDTPYAGVASIFRSALAAGRPPRVFEDGRQLRDFVHVRDAARGNALALCVPQPRPGTFNVASGEPRSVGQLAQALCDAAGPSAPRPVVTGEFDPSHVRHVFASIDRARAQLGYEPREDFAAAMREFAAAEPRAPVAR